LVMFGVLNSFLLKTVKCWVDRGEGLHQHWWDSALWLTRQCTLAACSWGVTINLWGAFPWNELMPS
jgi:hypothetical protein